MTMDLLATVDDLKLLLQNPNIDTPTATMLLEIATGIIQNETGQLIVQGTSSPILTGENSLWLDLPQWPIQSVTSVVMDGVTITDWVLRKQKLWRWLGWQAPLYQPSEVVVTYTHGYQPGARQLQMARGACLSLAQAGYTNPSGVQSEAIDDYKVTYAQAVGRMKMTDNLRDALVASYGKPAYVTISEC